MIHEEDENGLVFEWRVDLAKLPPARALFSIAVGLTPRHLTAWAVINCTGSRERLGSNF